jgi:Fe-S oxidoreductase
MKDYDKCCGGTLRATSPDIAALLGINKIRTGVETGADYMITSCPLCVSHLSISRAKAKIKKPKVISILDLLAKAYEK